MDDLATEYDLISDDLACCAKSLESFFRPHIPVDVRIDRISSRPKSKERFIAKAMKREAGEPRYPNPFGDIQDLLGARIVVLYLHDVERLKRLIPRLLGTIEALELEPEGFSNFGYFGWHAIARVPEEVLPDPKRDSFPRFFEVQIKTVFQHAWAEAEHDLSYKELNGQISNENLRLIAFAAAQAWGADNSFAAVLDRLLSEKVQKEQ
ncbi:hypothetical protein [Rhodophyticola sp.]|jgi:ppGpp synthetase/RelA/SpoT-type nucleotidyltranferase|uniref:hypothetical protein n=1 Tax=Rhodophyticola sp. TaxID=2680032 RepID=UPI003D2AD75C